MTSASITGSQGQATPWLRHLASAILDCAMLPVLDVARGKAMLANVMVSLGGADRSGPASLLEGQHGFVMRRALVAKAEALLDRVDPAAETSRWRQSTLALELSNGLLELPGVGQRELTAVRMRYALGQMASEAPDPLAADMRRFRDEPLDHLTDAHLLVRLAAAAWRLAHDGEPSLGAVAALLDQPEAELSSRMRQTTVWEPLLANSDSESNSRRRIGRFRSLETALLPLADADSLPAALTALEGLLLQWLGQNVLPLWVDGDGGLTMHGASALAGQRLTGTRSLAATAVAQERMIRQPITAPDSAVFDRQCAEHLDASSLVAVPVCAPEPIAVLLTNADVDATDLNLIGIHAARWLARFAAFERQLQSAAAEQRALFRLRLREVVHEISNPLSVIQNYLHLLGNRIDDSGPAQEQVRLISDELRRATFLLRTLTDEERWDSAPMGAERVGDVNALLSDVLDLVEMAFNPGAPTEIRFTPGIALPALAAADQRLHQVFLNLTKNALEAMPEGGILDVAVDRAVNGQGRRGIEIRISDTGEGIDPALLGQVFEAGVSGKGGDRGLGLAITSRLLEELGGEISCRSRVGAGTMFVVWLPAG